ncbi:MAG TPA: hypothetical protein PLM71_00480 [Syntrophorhabdaceae bacterium]|nr:hypothetical protein [Syntrophorhabdaceae bacterium]
MFWKKNTEKKVKLSKPEELSGVIQNYIATEKKIDPDIVALLRMVKVNDDLEEKLFHIRIFDNSEALAKGVEVQNYRSLDKHPELIIYEGLFNQKSNKVTLEEKNPFIWDIPILTQEEIQKKIEALSKPGETVFFYMAKGGKHGGPLGMGAAIVELNPKYLEKKEKKYIVYLTNVINMKPIFDTKEEVFRINEPKKIAIWIKNGHHKRMYSS